MQTKNLLGPRIKELRRLRQLSQENLAEKVGVDPKQIGRIEGGKSYPSMHTLECIARSLNVEMKDLFDFHHLIHSENLEEEVLRVFRLMNEPTKRLAIRILHILIQ